MKIAITTLYTPEIESFSIEAVKNFRMYSDLHGYDLFVYEDTLVDGLRGNWCKPKVLLNHIDQYDYVVWLDSDIAIIDMDRPLEDIIKPHEDKLFISTNDMGGWKLCNGFMIFKNTKKAKDILNLLWGQQRKMQSKGRGDQRFFIDFIDKINLPEKTYHLYPQSQICAPLFLKNEKSFSVHVMGIHIDDVRKKYIQHINKGLAKPTKLNLPTRKDLPKLLDDYSLNGIGVEIGVNKGEFSDFLLSNWNCQKLYSVDPWKNYDDYSDAYNKDQKILDEKYLETKQLLSKFKSRSEIVRLPSVEASELFPDSFFDFIYIDAAHEYKFVKEDIDAWLPKLKPNGIIAGHDFVPDGRYYFKSVSAGGIGGVSEFGVRKAVYESFDKDKVSVAGPNFEIKKAGQLEWPSWFILPQKNKVSKNKNVIYVVNAYDDYQMPDIWQYTKPTILSYAEKYNVDFVELKPSDLNKHVNRAYFKIDAIDEFVKSDYENAVIMDNDIAISNLSPDIFKECNKGVWALDISKTHKGMFEYFNTTFHDKFYPNKQKPKFSINSGLVVLDKLSAKKIQNTRQNLHSPEQISKTKVFKRDRTFTWEQEYFTYLINESNVEFSSLNYKFNFLGHYLQSMSTKDWNPELAPFYFLHMVGNSKKIGLRCLREYKNCFDQIPEPPFEELPRDSSHLQNKHKDMIALKDKWEDFLNADWLKFIDANLSHKQPMAEKYSCFNAGKKIGIVSLYTKEISDYAVYSENSIKEYALKNGYTFHVYRDSIDKNSHPNWSKPQALLNHIDDHEWIVWMDSDTLIFNDERKLESIISQCTPNKKTIACEDVGSRNEKMQKGSMFNSGVLFFASHAYAKNIINEWNDHECDKSSLYSGGGDQNVLCDIIWRKDAAKANIKIFPMNEFNTDPRMVDEKTFILHFMAYPQHFKKIFMKYWDSK